MSSIKNKKGFTLIEVLVAIVIISMVVVGGFSVFFDSLKTKLTVSENIEIQKNKFIATEKFFELIKNGGTIDYEEYFNRKVIGNNVDPDTNKFIEASRYGNTSGIMPPLEHPLFYYCYSNNSEKLSEGCYNKPDMISDDGEVGPGTDKTGQNQIYGQYSFQFVDYNSNALIEDIVDLGDEDGDGKITGDQDDMDIGVGPDVFDEGAKLDYLYLINPKTRERVFFEYVYELDPNAIEGATCSQADRTYCIGKIYAKKMQGKDWGQTHSMDETDKTYGDGVVDTWIVHQDLTGLIDGQDIEYQVASMDGDSDGITNIDEHKYSIFSSKINVKDVSYQIYPNISTEYAWKAKYDSVGNISPYIKLNMTLAPSIGSSKIKSSKAETNISVMISLNNYK